jgi:hypothetical protein
LERLGKLVLPLAWLSLLAGRMRRSIWRWTLRRVPLGLNQPHGRHARACHPKSGVPDFGNYNWPKSETSDLGWRPRLHGLGTVKTWMAGTSPAMTWRGTWFNLSGTCCKRAFPCRNILAAMHWRQAARPDPNDSSLRRYIRPSQRLSRVRARRRWRGAVIQGGRAHRCLIRDRDQR